jgi:hypothetical protein
MDGIDELLGPLFKGLSFISRVSSFSLLASKVLSKIASSFAQFS